MMFQIISQEQNLTVLVTGDSVGAYFCHAEVEGYAPVTTNAAEIQMTGPPQIESSPEQRGVAGDNVHIKCQARAIPRAQKVIWTYHGHQIEEGQSSLSFFLSSNIKCIKGQKQSRVLVRYLTSLFSQSDVSQQR